MILAEIRVEPMEMIRRGHIWASFEGKANGIY